MSRYRRLILAVLATAVVLAAGSAATWCSVAAPPHDGPSARQEGLGSPAREAAASLAAPVPGGPGFYSQHAVAFRPYEPTMSWAFWDGELYNPGGTDSEFDAPLSLPNGATITKLVAYYYDACGSRDLTVRLLRDASGSNLGDYMAELNSSGAPGGYSYGEDSTVDYPIIDQQSYSYRVVVLLPQGCSTNMSLESIRVDYGYQTGLPLVANGE